jgi:hypothetical protein
MPILLWVVFPFSFCRLVGMYGSGLVRPAERYAERIRRLKYL